MANTAFKGSRSDVFEIDPQDVVIVGLDEPYADAGREHPRYDARVKMPIDALDEVTIGTIIKHGILQPIRVAVEKHPKTGDNIHVVVMGRRRTILAREANKRLKEAGSSERVTLPVLAPMTARTGWVESDLEEVQIIENEHRKDDEGLVLAEKVSLFVKRRGGTPQARKDACQSFRRSLPSIESYLRLHAASEVVKKALTAGDIGITQASELAKLDASEQPVKLKELLKSGAAASVEETKEIVRAAKDKKGKKNEDKPRAFSRYLAKKALAAVSGETKEARAARKVLENATAYDAFRLFAGDVGVRVIPGLAGLIQGETGGDAE